MSLTQLSGGAYRDLTGTVLANGYLLFELSHDEQDSGVPAQIVAGIKRVITLDNNGNVAGSQSVEDVNTLAPAGAYYIVMAYTSDGRKAWKADQYFYPTGASYNLAAEVPVNPPSSPSGGSGLTLQTNEVNNGSQTLLDLHAGTNITLTDNGTGRVTIASSGGGTANGLTTLENGAPDQTGNSFYSVLSLTNWFCGHWEFVTNQSSYINFSARLPHTVPNTASIVLELFSGDSTAGHTAHFQTSDAIVNTGSMNVGSLTSASVQTYTTTSTAYQRVTLTFAVQSTLVADGMLVVKVATSTTGTQPSTNIYMLPYLLLT